MKTKILILSILYFFLVLSVKAQPWIKYLPQSKNKGDLTLSDYQKAFNTYWEPFQVDRGFYYENGKKVKALGWKQFKRWEYHSEQVVDPITKTFPKTSGYEVVKTHQNNFRSVYTTPNVSNWISLGPSTSNGGYAGLGRLNCIAFHPTDLNTYWVGAASGGLWVTYDNGNSWACLTDFNAVLAVSDIVIPSDYATSQTIYIATGDRDAFDNNSVGVLKSTNGGTTWNTTGITFSINQGKMVNRILIDPNNSQILLAATSDGVYKTIDGGTTWSNRLTTTEFMDMEYKPGDFSIIYGSRDNGRIFRSINSGSTWTQVYIGTDAARIELAVSAADPNVIYGVVASASNAGLNSITKSTNSGATFSEVFYGSSSNLMGWSVNGNDTGGQGWYDISIAVSPLDANIVLVGGVNSWVSTNGGSSWTISNHWYGADGVVSVHADKHNLTYRSNGTLFECNDGGVYFSDNNGQTWTDKTNGIRISQMYKLGVSSLNPTETITGLQDNGTKLNVGTSWFDVKGGDGMECLIDYSDNNIQYGTYVNGQIDRTMNHWVNRTAIEPADAGDGAWVTPYIINPVNPSTLYAGYAEVWKTTNRGDSWTQISNLSVGNYIRSMAIAPSDTMTLYVAGFSNIYKTNNNGGVWTNISSGLPTSNSQITYIAVKHDDPNTVWVTFGNYTAAKVFETTDGGANWTNISSGLPGIPVYTIVQNKLGTSGVQLYVGTEVGVYYKNGTNDWISYNNGLPNVKIGELEIYYGSTVQTSKLRAATYGRGLWETPLDYPSTPMSYNFSTTTQENLFTIPRGLTNQEIIGITINTIGAQSPLTATQFSFTTTGTTNPALDIQNAKLFYTGSYPTFETSNQVGSTIAAPNGAFVINGTQQLSEGNNYFWLSYDIQPTATLGNLVDATCTNVQVGVTTIPTVISPIGSRMIDLNYCAGGSSVPTSERITNFTCGTINNNSTFTNNGYQNFTNLNTNVNFWDNIPFSIDVENLNDADQIIIWIDLNRDGDFNDDGELIFYTLGSFTSPLTGNIFAPDYGFAGVTRMRVRLHNSSISFGGNDTPCGNSGYGEVEDYSVTLGDFENVTDLNLPAIKIYPNPTSNFITIESDNLSLESVELVDLVGKVIRTYSTPSNVLVWDIQQLPAGVYMIRTTVNGILQTHKFVKK